MNISAADRPGIPAPPERSRMVDRAEGIKVGECLDELTWCEAKSLVTSLRRLYDGRKWSIRASQGGSDLYAVWRRA